MNVQLSPSEWSVSEARSITAQLRHVASTGPEYDSLELFGSLTDYLDQLYGGSGFDGLLPERERVVMAGLIQRIRGRAATGSLLLDDHGVPVATSDEDPDYDTQVRLDQPVNAAVTLAGGRRLAAELAASDGWQGELGRALQGLYSHLDELYGGPGAFTELLTPEERAQIAQGTPNR